MLKRYADLTKAVDKTIANLDVSEEDSALIALVYDLAQRIPCEESGRTAAELAGKMLSALTALGATPEARKAIKEAAPSVNASGPSELDRLRQQRRAAGR